MKKTFDDPFIKNYPVLDLHGYDRYTAIVMVNDFIEENIKLKKNDIIIIHGIGTGIIKKTVHDTLKNHRDVDSFKLHGFNIGMTIVKLK